MDGKYDWNKKPRVFRIKKNVSIFYIIFRHKNIFPNLPLLPLFTLDVLLIEVLEQKEVLEQQELQ